MKTALALVLLTFMASAQDRVAEAFRQGVAEEETNHNLPAAIQAYESVLKLFDADRETAATALFRLAACYRNQGNHEQAQAAYRRLVAQFPEQTKLIEQGRVWADPAFVKARSDYRAALEEEIVWTRKRQETAAADWAAMSAVDAKKLQLETENQLAGFQAELAAFDAGLLPMQPAAPAGSEAAESRRDYRSLLERRVEFATNLWKLTNQQAAVGVASLRQLAERLMAVARAKKDLAAFDAGLAPPPARPAQ
jgi:tetratricopeptide (TPR) repeat protein